MPIAKLHYSQLRKGLRFIVDGMQYAVDTVVPEQNGAVSLLLFNETEGNYEQMEVTDPEGWVHLDLVNNPNKVLAICGVSGSGKTTLEARLVKELPHLFHKWYQFATRARRSPNEDIYIFVENETYDNFRPLLTAKNEYGTSKYGSIPDFKPNVVCTVIVNYTGLSDLMVDLANKKFDADLFILGLDVRNEDIPEEARREGRDEKFLDKERIVLENAHHIHTIEKGKYLDPEDVVTLLKMYKFI